jgi:CubicO group peptidase (beta-lactamase class C family)
MTIVLMFVLLLSTVGSTTALESGIPPGRGLPTASPGSRGPTDPEELEAFLDALLAKQMEDNHIAGAAVAVVKDGKLFFAKGYGYADVEKRIPVDHEQTNFRIGSVGKTFTATAVVQLVTGKLDLTTTSTPISTFASRILTTVNHP